MFEFDGNILHGMKKAEYYAWQHPEIITAINICVNLYMHTKISIKVIDNVFAENKCINLKIKIGIKLTLCPLERC